MFHQSDFEEYAAFLGLEGSDADLFYESYYGLDSEELEYDLIMEEHYDRVT